MKTFELTVATTGNIIIINHHAKPGKEVHVYDAKGTLLNDKLAQQSFDGVKFFQGSSSVQGQNMQDAVLSYIKAMTQHQLAKEERISKDTFGDYEVNIRLVMLEGKDKIITLIVDSENSESAKWYACNKFWKNPSAGVVQAIALSSTILSE